MDKSCIFILGTLYDIYFLGTSVHRSIFFPQFSGACQSGGTCENTPGSFQCTCPPEFTGHRCQYSTAVCTPSPCQPPLTCVHTITNTAGFLCEDVEGSGQLLTVTAIAIGGGSGGGDDVLGELDDTVNSIQEMNEVRITLLSCCCCCIVAMLLLLLLHCCSCFVAVVAMLLLLLMLLLLCCCCC